jgi:hypothetical protein
VERLPGFLGREVFRVFGRQYCFFPDDLFGAFTQKLLRTGRMGGIRRSFVLAGQWWAFFTFDIKDL